MGRIQKETIALVSALLGTAPSTRDVPWLLNKHTRETCGAAFDVIDAIFVGLGGSKEGLSAKQQRRGSADALFEVPFSFMLEVDELQHFTPYKAQALHAYPQQSRLGFDMAEYLALCDEHGERALIQGPPGYHKRTKDFPFPNGRDAQRAYLDAFRDLLPPLRGLPPALRIPVLGPRVAGADVERRLEAYLTRWGCGVT